MNRASLVFLSAVPLFPAIAFGQVVAPDAGRLLQELHSAPKAPPRAVSTTVEEPKEASAADGQRVVVSGFRVTGASVFPESELLKLLDDAVGQSLSLGELDALAARITRHYRSAGYLTAHAYLPPQEVKAGWVEISVLEGRLGKVSVNNAAGVSESALAPLSGLVPGEIVRGQYLESSLLALVDLPGVEVKSTLRPGASLGTSDFLVDVAPGAAFKGSVDIDSFGNRYTGAYRLGGTLFWNNPAGLGDQVSLRVQGNDGGMAYGRLGYQLPVGDQATRVGAAWSEMRYHLREEFSTLRASGEARIGSLYLSHPLLRSRGANWFAQAQYDDKRLEDRIDSTLTVTTKTLGNWTVGINGNFFDGIGGGAGNNLSLTYTSGHLNLSAAAAATDKASARSQGNFSKWAFTFQRSQNVAEAMTALISYTGQWAGKNLDSSEKFSLGGASGVRAYPQGEASGDEGQLLTLELHSRLGDAWEAMAFYDDGRATINRRPWTGSTNSRHLAGYGIGGSYASGGLVARVFAAWKAGTGQPVSDRDRSPRVWLQAAKYF